MTDPSCGVRRHWFETRQHHQHRQIVAAGFNDRWHQVLEDNMAHWAWLDDNERQRLGALAVDHMAAWHWEAAKGFDLTDDMMMLIAAEASLLVLERPPGGLVSVHAVVVHPSTMMLGGTHSQVAGVASDDPVAIIGQASFNGPVLVAWDAAKSSAHHPEHGRNVVFHEFAHKLDMATGTINGTPPMASPQAEKQWVTACTAAYGRVANGHSTTLPPYAGVNTAEFFAVATEVFFTTPTVLAAGEPDLYAVMADWFGQDPATRVSHRH